MLHVALLCGGLLAFAAPASESVSSETLAEYRVKQDAVGRDPDSQVELALWCEAHDLAAERTRHLARAVLTDPNHVKARALLGLLKYAGRWETPETVTRKVQADESLTARLAEYNTRRATLEDKDPKATRRDRKTLARDHANLGNWCEENGLEAEAKAHFTQAVFLDPRREATWKRLGYVKHEGRWMTPDQAETERISAQAQRKADREWEPRLRKYRAGLNEPSKRVESLRELDAIDDPRAVPLVVRLFGDGTKDEQLIAVKILGRINSPGSTRSLAALAVFTRIEEARWSATEILRNRQPRDFAGLLVDSIHKPMTVSVQPVGGPGQPGGLLVETPRLRMLRTYDVPPVVNPYSTEGILTYDLSNGMPLIVPTIHSEKYPWKNGVPFGDLYTARQLTANMVAQANLKAADSQQRLLNDIAAIEKFNEQFVSMNSHLARVLQMSLDAPDYKDDETAWQTWWYDKVGYRYVEPEPVTVVVDASPQPPPLHAVHHMSCFAAGTTVRTLDGRRAIESIRVGDQVLTQDTATGALSFETVNVVHHNPPSATVKVAIDNGETLTASIYHRFYRAGRGWAMARELKPGDVLRTLGGLARVVSAESGSTVPVYNLDVANTRTFFVGKNDALVHDNTLPDPHARLFDARPTTLAVSAR